ncbi:MAG: putative O-glycosylation ligase, exosortase A system-associated [Planctomycetes bacterium]|nr:putative O-glycosylation ligase, exosortase A system-associated [Planctomycetota bacterium]
MRDLLVFAVVMLTLPLAWRRPFLGLLVFSWLAYMRPQDLCWGFARNMRLSFYVGFVMVAGWWANERGRRPFARWDVRSWLLILLTVLVAASYGLAKHHSAYFNRYFFEYIKIIVVALFTTGQVDSRQRFRLMLWTIALCLAFYGVKGGIFGVLTGGSAILRGPGGMMEDNNDFALALVMNVPLLWYLGFNDRALPFVRLGSQVGILLTTITVLLTHSRGAFLSLVGTALWIAWRSGRLIRAMLTLAVCGVVFLLTAPASVLERLASIGDTQESSINARFVAWRTAFKMIEDNPLFGVGMRNFQPRYKDYSVVPIDTESFTTYVAHNSYLQIWAESGTLAFAVYMSLLASVFLTCRRLVLMGRLRADMEWARDYARMMEATTVGFMIGAMFLNRGHFDLVYHWLALVTSLAAVAWVAWARGPQGSKTVGGVRGIHVQWDGDGGHTAAVPVRALVSPRWGRRR